MPSPVSVTPPPYPSPYSLSLYFFAPDSHNTLFCNLLVTLPDEGVFPFCWLNQWLVIETSAAFGLTHSGLRKKHVLCFHVVPCSLSCLKFASEEMGLWGRLNYLVHCLAMARSRGSAVQWGGVLGTWSNCGGHGCLENSFLRCSMVIDKPSELSLGYLHTSHSSVVRLLWST